MTLLNTIKKHIRHWRSVRHYLALRKRSDVQLDFTAAELLRNTHSVEKGLSLEHPRLGFGQKKQAEMMMQIETLLASPSPYHREACAMALCALEEYVSYHKEQQYSDDHCRKVTQFLEDKRGAFPNEKCGGTQMFYKSQLTFDEATVETFFQTRHSIRDFDKTPIDKGNLEKALRLAQSAPSACNRQGVRAYVLDPTDKEAFVQQLSGIGGFAEDVNAYVLVTAKTSAYRTEEDNQYIVSAAMYAAYASLTLHLYGMGACVVQRPLLWNQQWERYQTLFRIPCDEQLVCLLAVGNLKESCRVPISHRMTNEEMIRFL